MKIYHYTIADRLCKILIDGYLKLTPQRPFKGEPQLVWFTQKDEWDKTAFYGYDDDLLDSVGRIRITYDEAILDNADIQLVNSEIPFLETKEGLGMYMSLVNSAEKVGVDEADWFVAKERIPICLCEKIELWKDNEWKEIPIRRIND